MTIFIEAIYNPKTHIIFFPNQDLVKKENSPGQAYAFFFELGLFVQHHNINNYVSIYLIEQSKEKQPKILFISFLK